VDSLVLPFVARSEPGEVRVTYSPNGDPAQWGFDILGLEGDVSRAAAFPVFEATVVYPRQGYAGIFGWVQVVHYWAPGDAREPELSVLDAPPQLRGLGLPYLAWGVAPRAFDAPLDTPDGVARWQAVTFLTQTPDGLMSRTVEPFVGVTWGYTIGESGAPTIAPVAPARADDWSDVRPLLERECPAWTFGEFQPMPVRPA
jgi:hypothetical protein